MKLVRQSRKVKKSQSFFESNRAWINYSLFMNSLVMGLKVFLSMVL